MIHLLLPSGICLSLVAFTAMRKVGQAKYLKPHSLTIAIAAFVTVFAFVLAELRLVSIAPGRGLFDPLVFFAQNGLLALALLLRREISQMELMSILLVLSTMALCLYISAEECDRNSNIVLGLESFALVGYVVSESSKNNSGCKNRKLWLCALYGVFGLIMGFACRPLTIVYAFQGLTATWIVKIHHPLLGDEEKVEDGYSAVPGHQVDDA